MSKIDTNSFENVHVFDGKWTHNIKTETKLEDKCLIFNNLYQELKNLGVESNSLNGLILVIENTQKSSNFDSVNNVYADDILVEICKKIFYPFKSDISDDKKKDVLTNIAEQLSDMYQLGRCPQGRSTRLIQIYNFL